MFLFLFVLFFFSPEKQVRNFRKLFYGWDTNPTAPFIHLIGHKRQLIDSDPHRMEAVTQVPRDSWARAGLALS